MKIYLINILNKMPNNQIRLADYPGVVSIAETYSDLISSIDKIRKITNPNSSQRLVVSYQLWNQDQEIQDEISDTIIVFSDGSIRLKKSSDTEKSLYIEDMEKKEKMKSSSYPTLQQFKNLSEVFPNRDDTFDGWISELCFKVAVHTIENNVEEMASGAIDTLFGETAQKIYDNEYDIIKSFTRVNPWIGDIVYIEKIIKESNLDDKLQEYGGKFARGESGKKWIKETYDDPWSFSTIKMEMISIKTKREFMTKKKDKYILEYNPGYRFITSNGFVIYRDSKNSFHLEKFVPSESNASVF